MTSSISKAQKGLVSQLIKLRKLTQPYFLPYTKNNGWLFVYLLIALLFCVGGTVLFLLTGLMSLLTNVAPDITNQFLGGVQNSLKVIWDGPSGIIISSLFALGIFSFITVRGQLRQRRWIPWLLLGVIILMLLSVNGINAGITFLVRDITNALIQKDENESYKNLWILGICFIAALPIRSFQFYFSAKLQLLWREWLSKSLITDYLDDRTYYILNPNDESETNIDNPDQRITEDARDFTAQTIDLSLNIFDSLLVFSLNIFILLSISKELTLALIVYATLVSSLLLFASRKLFKLNYDQLRFEADFRYGLVHVRNNAESIAFYSGENQEEKEVSRRLKSVVDNFNLLIIWEALLRVLQRSGIYGSVFIPFIILAGPILSGQMDYGSFQQANLNYNLLEGSLFFIIYKIEALARFSASIGRLEGFQSNMNEIRDNKFDDFKAEIKTNDSIILKNVSINRKKLEVRERFVDTSLHKKLRAKLEADGTKHLYTTESFFNQFNMDIDVFDIYSHLGVEKIMDLNENESKKKITKTKVFSYSIKVADFYYKDTAKMMLKRIKNDTSIKNIKIIQLSKTKYRLLIGPFNDIKSLRETFENMNSFNFENLEILNNA